jgi:MFS family permease
MGRSRPYSSLPGVGVYQTEQWRDVLKLRVGGTSRSRVSSTVILLGLTSLCTDISSEMVSTILPIYLVSFLHLSPLQFGVIDGLYQGVSALVRIVGGYAADRWGRHKEVAGAGYGLSAVCKLALLAAGSVWPMLVGAIVADRIGKGIRTAPRDAMIALSTPQAGLATAFGVHRALDTTGAMLGPLLAFGLLAAIPNGFDVVFVSSFCIAMVGVGLLALFVRSPGSSPTPYASTSALRTTLGLLATPRFRSLLVVTAALSLVTVSDGFVYLVLQRRLDFNTSAFPLLYVASAMVYLLVAVPLGQLADRYGRVQILVAGYALLIAVYAMLLLPVTGTPVLVGCLVLVGIATAATDGVLVALASATLPQHWQASGLALLTTFTGLGRLLASVLFGSLWTFAGLEVTVLLFLTGLLAATVLTWLMLTQREKGVTS